MSHYDHKKIEKRWPSSVNTLRKGKQKIVEYNHKRIELKWQKVWEKKKLYQAREAVASSATRRGGGKFYGLIEFPYPSSDGLHVGHIRSNTAMDIISRKRRMEGFNVLYPIGWDAFGLPTENYAIKTGTAPKIVTKKNTDNFRRQLKALGFSFDWSREINTTDPAYYKWTQWIFLQFFKHSLAYKKKMAINWCPKDKIGLANEEVINGCCERCGTPVEKREKEQWMLAITKYADRLDKDLDTVDYLERIKIQQRNWIGRSEGAEISFQLSGASFQNLKPDTQNLTPIKVFTTRPDTLFGATYLVLAPEHNLVKSLIHKITNKDEIYRYIDISKKKTEIERTATEKEKTGVELKGIKAINPANQELIPIWIADYVLPDYGTGAIMAVPAHDERDFQFANKYNLPIKNVIEPLFITTNEIDSFKKDEPSIERNAVVCVIKHWSEDKYLCLDWKKIPWRGFVVGGIENNERLEDAALREIQEETGYKNMRFIKSFSKIHSKFFQSVKKVNRFAHFYPIYVELVNEGKEEISQEEKDLHSVIWISKSEVEIFLNRNDMKFAWNVYLGKVTHSKQGLLVNSGKFDGLESETAKNKITEFVGGKIVTTYKLRDWVFSRQRYWGEPIPLIYCENCKKEQLGHPMSKLASDVPNVLNAGWVPVPEKDLPVKLPEVKNYQPTDTGESPLASIVKWVNTKCPVCGGKARRETDTMPNWAGSSWYYIAYCISENLKSKAPRLRQGFGGQAISKQIQSTKIQNKLKYWSGSKLQAPSSKLSAGPVDWYNGGMEHTTLHLLYSRFWHKFLYDLKLVPTSEPYAKRTSHGLILGEGGVKMSKSLGNIVNPDELIERFGADSLRLYEMFMGPFDQPIAWNTDGLVGMRRFLERVFRLSNRVDKNFTPDKAIDSLCHKTIKKVTDDIESMHFNTAISAMMIFGNELEKQTAVAEEHYKALLTLLSPFAPHIAEELKLVWGGKKMLVQESWPKFDPTKISESKSRIAIQVDGKTRGELVVNSDVGPAELEKLAKALPEVSKWFSGKTIIKVVHVPNRLLNFVLRDTV